MIIAPGTREEEDVNEQNSSIMTIKDVEILFGTYFHMCQNK
jgi:hypothetical protein